MEAWRGSRAFFTFKYGMEFLQAAHRRQPIGELVINNRAGEFFRVRHEIGTFEGILPYGLFSVCFLQ